MKTLTYTFIFALLTTPLLATNPVASNALINGTNHVGAVLTGSYDYSDADGNPESGTTYQWYRSDDNTGTNKAALTGANSFEYTLVAADFGKFISFEVTPRDNNAEIGLPHESSYSSDIKDYSDFNLGSNNMHTVSGLENYGSFTTNTNNTINVGNGDSLIIWLNFVVNNNVSINVVSGGYFEIKGSLDAHNGASLSISGDLVVSGDIVVDKSATFSIAPGGSMDVTGSLTAGNDAILNIEGTVSISGSLEVGTNSQINVDMNNDSTGTLSIGGDLIGGTGTTINGDGPVSVGGSVSGEISDTDNNQLTTLPVELIEFTVVKKDNLVSISWKTASEINNDYFTIERSSNGMDYTSIGNVTGAGFSNQILNYNFYDQDPLNNTAYYRLKQTDYDGQFSYSNIASVKSELGLSAINLNVYPNPATLENNVINVNITGTFDFQTATIKVINMNGFEVLTEEIEMNGQSINKSIIINRLIKGTYILILVSDSAVYKDKIVIL